MTEKFDPEISANIGRAEESLKAANKLVEDGFFDIGASRAYYAAFYAATAVLLFEGLEFGKHSGVIASFHKEFIKTGRLDKKFGKDLNWLFELRGIGDYGETDHVPADDARKALEAAEAFLKAIKKIVER